MHFAQRYGLHLVSDEIYAGSLLGPKGAANFVSMGQVAFEERGGLGDNVHIVWGFSKAFGISGFRVGALYTQNEDVSNCANAMSCSPVSSDTQSTLRQLLADHEFVQSYVADNSSKLTAQFDALCMGLEALGYPNDTLAFRPTAGLFAVLDFRVCLSEPSFAAEQEIFEKMVMQAKVLLTPGQEMGFPEPGYFRICYASVDASTLFLALQRIKICLMDTCSI
jgi:1-aminocyclopropane-1-carboxylate synthase